MKNDQIPDIRWDLWLRESSLCNLSAVYTHKSWKIKYYFVYAGMLALHSFLNPLCGDCQETHVITPACRHRMESYLVSFGHNTWLTWRALCNNMPRFVVDLRVLNYSPCPPPSARGPERNFLHTKPRPPSQSTVSIGERGKRGVPREKVHFCPCNWLLGGVSYRRTQSYRQVR